MFEKTKTFLAAHALPVIMFMGVACVGLCAVAVGAAVYKAEIVVKDGRLTLDGTTLEVKDGRLFVDGVRWTPAKRCDCPALPASQP